MRQFSDDWLESRRTKRGLIKPRTKADYRRLLDRHILPAFGDVSLRSITADRVKAWYLSLNAQTPTERAHAYQLLGAIFTAADPRVHIVAQDPCQIEGAGQVTRAHKVRAASLDKLVLIVDKMPGTGVCEGSLSLMWEVVAQLWGGLILGLAIFSAGLRASRAGGIISPGWRSDGRYRSSWEACPEWAVCQRGGDLVVSVDGVVDRCGARYRRGVGCVPAAG